MEYPPAAVYLLSDAPVGWILLLIASYPICKFLYNIFLHPLRKFPGPRFAAGSPLAHFYWIYTGNMPFKLRELHDKYGSVVRISPNTLVYNSPGAWKGICGHRKSGAKTFEKDREFYPVGPSGPSIVAANEADHTRERRLLSHAFSEKAMREQEVLLQTYVDLLVSKLQEKAASQTLVDMTQWYNFTTFDIIGDLVFGEPFHCLEKGIYHPWVVFIFRTVKAAALMRPFLSLLSPAVMQMLLPRRLRQMREDHYALSKEKVHRRLQSTTTRPDFMTYILRHNDERGMTTGEIEANAGILVLAGSETTATLLSGFTYYLLTHPEIYRRLVEEIRGAFQNYEDMTFLSVARLRYLDAVLEESLRMYPPVAGILPRKVPPGGAIIEDHFVPEGTSVTMAYFSAFRSSSNFAMSDSFIPERWLDDSDPRFAADRRDALQPFSYGPRNCLGRNLAYAEMRLIASKLLWSFDMALEPGCEKWNLQKAYVMWEKTPLMVNLTPVRR